MKKLKVVFAIMLIMSLILSSTIYASTENEEETIKQMKIFEIERLDNIEEPLLPESAPHAEELILENSAIHNKYHEVDSMLGFIPSVMAYEEFLYQVQPLDFEQSKQILEMIEDQELSNKRNNIEKQKILLSNPNYNVTISEINKLIDEYNEYCTNLIEEINKKLPNYDDNAWKPIDMDNLRISYTDPTQSTAYALVYVKITDSRFSGDKTVYRSAWYDINYDYLSRKQETEVDEENSLTGLKNTANLTINNIQIVKDGNIYRNIIETSNENSYVKYNREKNNLLLCNYPIQSMSFNDMGTDFTITTVTTNENGTNIEQYNTSSGVKIKGYGEKSVSESDMIVVNNIESGETYNKVTTLLSDKHSNIKVYDISLERENVKVQPNGKVTVSLPINDNVDTSKVVIYRIEDDGTKTEYTVQIEEDGETKYATFETDHFSTYVLAERKEEKEPVVQPEQEVPEQEGQQSKPEQPNEEEQKKDDTVAQGTLPKAGIGISIISMIIAVVVISILTYSKYNKMRDIK